MLRFYINLDKSTDRKTYIENALKALHLSAERIPAVDGRDFSVRDIQKLLPPTNSWRKNLWGTVLSPAQCGCFLSHRKCWKRLIDSEEKWALILEDDALLTVRAEKYCASSDWIPTGVDLVKLYTRAARESCYIKNILGLDEGTRLVQILKPRPTGTLAYFISREAAAFAYNATYTIPCPVDDYLFGSLFPVAKKYPMWQLDPACVTQVKSIGSTIGYSSTKKETSLHQILNPFRHWALIKRSLCWRIYGQKSEVTLK